MATDTYCLEEVLAIANAHPFYNSTISYPPNADGIEALRGSKVGQSNRPGLKSRSLLSKKDLYKVIQRLVNDTSVENTYRRGVYTSVTGGGSGGQPLFFATDVHENRRQRASFGRFLRTTGLIGDDDWVLTTHCAGQLYRSLDLMLEVFENAGATVLAAGNYMTPADVVQLLMSYHVNVLTGDGSQIIQVVHHISTLSPEQRQRVRLTKVIYSSEVLTAAQRLHIKEALGSNAKIYSLLGSAEAGPWGVSSAELCGRETTTATADFVYDTRHMLIEILPEACVESGSTTECLQDGEKGIIVQTSLCRLRNPLVRYVSGDIGSLHSLPESARSVVPEADWAYLKIVRLEGRDRRFGFDWDGFCIGFEDVAAMMSKEDIGVLQWQVILYKMEPSQEAGLEIRVLCSSRSAETKCTSELRHFFHVYSANEHRFRIVYVDDLDGFERSATGRKVIKLVDRFTKS